MIRSAAVFSLATLMLLGAVLPGQSQEDKKSDRDTVVAAGKEFTLTPTEVTPEEKPGDGPFEVKLKPAKDAVKVKMPAEAWTLGFFPQAIKGTGVGVGGPVEGAGLANMRTVPGKADEEGAWQVDPGDVITHVNGYAVNSVEDVICAVSTAKNKTDVQIVVKDVSTEKLNVFYVTATKR
ncbi:PDZ domain-containing protein [Fimbriiglobus ruber]|uniref:Uncharacterized protein n=1 Tax=Fimbriiglobus ruber TaxID=1908690 RepID=A0A225DE53_9BACT|nr:PDZ domain-containing protein [Fimbriiglobus ruber]OWK36808.1 hypothetical protein FRUB_09371 [Fimbriiglobus ruber]